MHRRKPPAPGGTLRLMTHIIQRLQRRPGRGRLELLRARILGVLSERRHLVGVGPAARSGDAVEVLVEVVHELVLRNAAAKGGLGRGYHSRLGVLRGVFLEVETAIIVETLVDRLQILLVLVELEGRLLFRGSRIELQRRERDMLFLRLINRLG